MKSIEDKVADRLKGIQSTSGVDGGALWESIGSELDAGKSGGTSFTWAKGLGLLFFLVGVGGAFYFWANNDIDTTSTSIADSKVLRDDPGIVRHDEHTEFNLKNEEDEGLQLKKQYTHLNDPDSFETIESSKRRVQMQAQESTIETLKNSESSSNGSAIRSLAAYSAAKAVESASGTEVSEAGVPKNDQRKAIVQSDPRLVQSFEIAHEDIEANEQLLDDVQRSIQDEIGIQESHERAGMAGLGESVELKRESLETLEVIGYNIIGVEVSNDILGDLHEIGPSEYVQNRSLMPNELIALGGIISSGISIRFSDQDSEFPSHSFTSRPGYSVLILGSWNIGKDFRLRTGISRDLLKQRFDHLERSTSEVTIEDHIIDLAMDSLGMVTPVIGAHIQSARSERIIEHYNLYRLTSVPLLFGYEKDLGDFNWGLDLGISMNWVTYQDGRGLDQNGRIIEFSSSDDTGLLSDSFISYSVQPNLSYSIDKRVDLKMMPTWSISSSKASNLAGAENQVHRISLLMGIGYAFR